MNENLSASKFLNLSKNFFLWKREQTSANLRAQEGEPRADAGVVQRAATRRRQQRSWRHSDVAATLCEQTLQYHS